KRGISQLPISAPTMPIAMSPIRPNPPPATILPASQPAISPTSRTTRRLSPEMCMAPPHQNRALLFSGPDNSDGTSWVPEFLAEQPSQQCPLWVKSRHLHCTSLCPLYPQKRTHAAQQNRLRYSVISSTQLSSPGGNPEAGVVSHFSRNIRALTAQITVLADISTAPTAGP